MLPLIAFEPPIFRCGRIDRHRSTNSHHDNLGVILESSFLLYARPVGEFPGTNLLIPFEPMVDHVPIPITACSQNSDQNSSGAQMLTCVSNDAQGSSLAILEQIGWIDQKQINHPLHAYRFKRRREN